jgi:hypothetical protein
MVPLPVSSMGMVPISSAWSGTSAYSVTLTYVELVSSKISQYSPVQPSAHSQNWFLKSTETAFPVKLHLISKNGSRSLGTPSWQKFPWASICDVEDYNLVGDQGHLVWNTCGHLPGSHPLQTPSASHQPSLLHQPGLFMDASVRIYKFASVYNLARSHCQPLHHTQ